MKQGTWPIVSKLANFFSRMLHLILRVKEMPSPIIEYGKFAYPQRWWLQRGRPEWLDDSRWEVRAFRATVFLGLMGSASGGLSAVSLVSLSHLWKLVCGRADIFEILLFLGPGFWFGLVTLVPLSRWLGRGWIMTGLAVPISMLASFCGVTAFLVVDPFMGESPKWIPGGRKASGFYAGFIGAFIVSLWMGHPRKKLAWLSGLLAVTLATLGCGLLFLRDSTPPFGDLAPQFTGFLGLVALYQIFQCLVAIGLGVRLWSDAGVETKKAPKFGAEGD